MTFANLPVIGPDEAAAIPALVEHYETGLTGASDARIERAMGSLATLYPSGKLSQDESAARLELYVELLRDLPADVLSAAFRDVAKTSKFFPSVAEIRAAAEPALTERRRVLAALRMLLLKHRQEWEPPFQEDRRCKPEEASAIVAEMGLTPAAAARVEAFVQPGSRRKPTRDDYLAMGVPPEAIDAALSAATA